MRCLPSTRVATSTPVRALSKHRLSRWKKGEEMGRGGGEELRLREREIKIEMER
jgi:hypothetical protein